MGNIKAQNQQEIEAKNDKIKVLQSQMLEQQGIIEGLSQENNSIRQKNAQITDQVRLERDQFEKLREQLR